MEIALTSLHQARPGLLIYMIPLMYDSLQEKIIKIAEKLTPLRSNDGADRREERQAETLVLQDYPGTGGEVVACLEATILFDWP